MAAFDELVREELVRVVGASNYTAERLGQALATSDELGVVRFGLLQPNYNLMDRSGFESGLAEVCRSEALPVVPYFALARGFLTGKYRPGAPLPASPRVGGIAQEYLNDRGWRVLAALDRVAGTHAATPAQVALAWLLDQPGVIAPIASATTPEQVRELMGAAALELTADDRDDLASASAAADDRQSG